MPPSVAPRSGRVTIRGRRGWAPIALVLACALAGSAHAAPFIWDQDGDGVDDRIQLVHQLGFQFAFEQADTLLRQRIGVTRIIGGLLYDVYVIYDHPPTSSDLTALTLLGMPVLHRFQAVPAVHSAATFVQVQALRDAAVAPGVERVEAVPILYPLARVDCAAIGVRDPSGQVFPTWESSGGGDGSGVVIAFLDTGINDAPDGAYPGHESLAGRFLGGASFVGGDSTLDTPPNGSTNPVDRGGAATHSHGTHVAGIALGSGGASGYARGVAPGARFVDVKVLSDVGYGTEVPQAIDWCIHNRARDWGDPDPALRGIDVINLSLSSVDESDGQDMASQLAARAVELGIVVVASVGNDGLTAHVPSPAGGRGVIVVGALDDSGTPLGADDQVAEFGNRGPRADDGDLDTSDEAKPDLVAPGVGVLSADGDLTSDGAQYQRLTGTSMSAAFVSGAAALLRSSNPTLTPEQIGSLLHATATRPLCAGPPPPPGFDVRWSAEAGFGGLDLQGARLELMQPQRTQVVRLELAGAATTVNATLRTQRERGAAWLVFERAPDLSGNPGSFAPYDSVAATGDSSLADVTDRQVYTRSWPVPPAELGDAFWYRVSYTEGGVRYEGPARRFVSPAGTSLATLQVTVVHNAYDTDAGGMITAQANPASPSGGGNRATTTALTIPLPSSASAASSDWLSGSAGGGNIEWQYQIEVTDPAAASCLPPDGAHAWLLSLAEGGDPGLHGRVTAFKLTWHSQGGDVVYTGGPTPQQTSEGSTLYVGIPEAALAVNPPHPDGITLRYGPNPIPTGGTVTFSSAAPQAGPLSVFDLSGRRVGAVPFVAAGGVFEARWQVRRASGEPLSPGIYFARAARGPTARIAVVGR